MSTTAFHHFLLDESAVAACSTHEPLTHQFTKSNIINQQINRSTIAVQQTMVTKIPTTHLERLQFLDFCKNQGSKILGELARLL
jgi:hypothetical protein